MYIKYCNIEIPRIQISHVMLLGLFGTLLRHQLKRSREDGPKGRVIKRYIETSLNSSFTFTVAQ